MARRFLSGSRHPGESRGPGLKQAFKKKFKTWIPAFAGMTVLFFLIPLYSSDPIAEFPNRVHKITLKNGLRVLVVERPASQTVSFAMYIRTGGLDDESGRSGLAHMFEHMLFKGTKTIGTKNYGKEEDLLAQMDKLEDERQKNGDSPELAKRIEELNKKHEALLEPEEYWQIYERAGAQDFNAATGYDFTNYTVSLPINYLKLWFAMEADRMKNPVLREFYKERSVVMEERRMRVDTSPSGKLWEAFLATAFIAHPYGRPIIGWESDVTHLTRADAQAFFKQNYGVSRLVVGIVGGVKADEIEKLCRQYFESIPSNPAVREGRIPVEPMQEGERRVEVEFDAEPSVLVGYHRPSVMHPDDAPLSVLAEILSSGRTSRFYRNIVEKKKIAVSVWASGSGPGERAPTLFVLGGSPRAPFTAVDVEKAMIEEIDALKKDGPSDREVQKIKNNLESSAIRGLSSNAGLAGQLSYSESVTGDWAFFIKTIEAVRAVTPADVKRVANQYLVPSNKTTAVLVRKKS